MFQGDAVSDKPASRGNTFDMLDVTKCQWAVGHIFDTRDLSLFQEISPAEDFGDTSMGDPELPGDVAGPHPLVGKLHDPLANHVRKGATIHKHSSELVHTSVA